MEEPRNVLCELAASIAHEIKNPLALIKANLQLMELDDIDHRFQKNFRVMYGEINKINKLLLDFMQMTKPQRLDVTVLEIKAILDKALIDMEASLQEKKIWLQVNKTEEDAFVLGDKGQLQEVFINVIKNAIEAIETEGKIVLSVFKIEGYIVVKIEDNGKGIPEEELKNIGKPFFTTKSEGTGLGVSISKKILEQHGGIFSITSIEGKGCTVAITLPEYRRGQRLEPIQEKTHALG